MTFANLSQVTAASQRFYHRSLNSNSLITIEIHDQGKPTYHMGVSWHETVTLEFYVEFF